MAIMRMSMEEALSHKRILLDLIDDTDVAVCLHRMGEFEERAQLAAGLQVIINRHINNMKAEIIDTIHRSIEDGGMGLISTDYANCPE